MSTSIFSCQSQVLPDFQPKLGASFVCIVKLDAQLRTRKLQNESNNTQTNFIFRANHIISSQLTP